jgi:hypothetical protein
MASVVSAPFNPSMKTPADADAKYEQQELAHQNTSFMTFFIGMPLNFDAAM